MRSLSRLKALQAFEAAARHGSFVGASRELHVSPPAVGQMVRSLEDWLGAPLFRRRSAGSDRLVPLDDTRDALAKLGAGLDALDQALRQLKARSQGGVVMVTASQAIVAKWLLPRLDDFATRFPDIIIRLDVTDRLVDLRHGEADIGIRCGAGSWQGLRATRLGDEQIIVVCAPALLPTEEPVGLNWLKSQNLLHDATPASRDTFPGWKDWAALLGANDFPSHRGTQINASSAIIQAAINGQGVALARRALVSEDIGAGRLVRLFADIEMPIVWGYYAVATEEALTRPTVAAFQNWLLETWGR